MSILTPMRSGELEEKITIEATAVAPPSLAPINASSSSAAATLTLPYRLQLQAMASPLKPTRQSSVTSEGTEQEEPLLRWPMEAQPPQQQQQQQQGNLSLHDAASRIDLRFTLPLYSSVSGDTIMRAPKKEQGIKLKQQANEGMQLLTAARVGVATIPPLLARFSSTATPSEEAKMSDMIATLQPMTRRSGAAAERAKRRRESEDSSEQRLGLFAMITHVSKKQSDGSHPARGGELKSDESKEQKSWNDLPALEGKRRGVTSVFATLQQVPSLHNVPEPSPAAASIEGRSPITHAEALDLCMVVQMLIVHNPLWLIHGNDGISRFQDGFWDRIFLLWKHYHQESPRTKSVLRDFFLKTYHEKLQVHNIFMRQQHMQQHEQQQNLLRQHLQLNQFDHRLLQQPWMSQHFLLQQQMMQQQQQQQTNPFVQAIHNQSQFQLLQQQKLPQQPQQ